MLFDFFMVCLSIKVSIDLITCFLTVCALEKKGSLLIQEIILENFMSYEYARIPLKPGLNIICGPNGSGKSAILLAISVALGQAYTERGRRLSDLIRWGKDTARVTLSFDNTKKDGERPLPKFDTDTFRLSRYLKKDGTYWFEANFHTITKAEVTRLLSEFGIDPDNMLIIMHQHMMEEFGIVTPQQKLKMVEEAVGLGEYRERVIEAQEKLNRILSEEESIASLLENAEQTLAYWKGEYDRYLRRKELLQRRDLLERELAWARLIRQERLVQAWRERIRTKEDELSRIVKGIKGCIADINALKEELNNLRFDQRGLFYSLLELEKQKAEAEATARLLGETLGRMEGLGRVFRGVFQGIKNPEENPGSSLLQSLHEEMRSLEEYVAEMSLQIQFSKRKRLEVGKRISTTQTSLGGLESRITSATDNYLDARVREAVLNFRKERAEDELVELNRQLREAERELNQLRREAGRAEPRIETERSPQEVSEEIKITNAHLASFPEVSEDVARMFASYSSLYNELKAKAAVVSENLEKALQEVEERKRTWRGLLQSLLSRVNRTYQAFLDKIDAVGRVRLVDAQDVEHAGLEVTVGFKGAEPTILDNYTQSGGERSTAVMAFLLALQQHVKSTIRAVDEFDVHMDPRNRETISAMIMKEVGDARDIQHIVITPGQLLDVDENVHVITVQNVQGRSDVRTVA